MVDNILPVDARKDIGMTTWTNEEVVVVAFAAHNYTDEMVASSPADNYFEKNRKIDFTFVENFENYETHTLIYSPTHAFCLPPSS